ncbi:MAG TPA: tetratricopeptide repeat protein [Bryobacteraceae bacterium]|nr:tetratricopeptide repeat protein [Bryobacteraceae bacterium]
MRRQLGRILASSGFVNSERMSRFLRFVVERTLAGRAGELKEYAIGVEVFDRRPDYDPRVDPVVRVEARRLRAKLEAYYEQAAGELRIELPKGSYVPVFAEPPSGAAALAAMAPERPGIAVLRFANLSRDPDTEYFSDGLTQELIHRLTAVERLKVVAWSTAAKIIGNERDAVASARQLGVSSVLVGSVRTNADRLRVMAQLIDTRDGAYLWSETYDRQVADVFAIQEEIAAAIVGTLRARLGVTGSIRPAQGTRNSEAYKLYLQGRHHWGKRSRAGLARSVELFRAAIDADSGFAAAWAGLADAWTLFADYGLAAPQDCIPRARQAAERALELDPMSAEAATSLGSIAVSFEWDWNKSEEYFRQAIRLNPGYATAHHWFGIDHLALNGRFVEAEDELRIAADLDPLSAIIREGMGMVAMLQGRNDEAMRCYRQCLEIDPEFHKAYGAMGRAAIQQGRLDEAVSFLEQARARLGDVPSVLAALGQAHALLGDHERRSSFSTSFGQSHSTRTSRTPALPSSRLDSVTSRARLSRSRVESSGTTSR